MNIETARFNMIEQQIRTWDVLDQDVLNLLGLVRREDFVPSAHRALAFADIEIPLPGGQNMFSPKVEARLLQELAVKSHETVLEIGTGSGFMAALLAHQGAQVKTVEISPELCSFAKANLARAGVLNATVIPGDGSTGWAEAGEVDVLMVSGGLPFVPQSMLDQLRIGGRLAAIVGTDPAMQAVIVTRSAQDVWETLILFETSARSLQNAAHVSGFVF